MTDPQKHMYVCKASAGTGKTYTLAAHYIALLMNDVPSKNILAVTFTNKATEEMKQRIITYLNAIAYHQDIKETTDFLEYVRHISTSVRQLKGLSNEQYQQKAKDLLNLIMSNYDNLAISTIDAFLQTLLTGLAQAIGQAAGFGIDLDMTHAITTAVDEVLSIDVAESNHIKDAVTSCLKQRLNSEEKWDLRPSLIKLIEGLYKENVQQMWEQIPFITSDNQDAQTAIDTFRSALEAYTSSAAYKEMAQLYDQVKNYESDQVINGGKYYYSLISRVGKSLYGGWKDSNQESDDAFRSMKTDALEKTDKNGRYTFVQDKFKQNPDLGHQVRNNIVRICELCELLRPLFFKYKVYKEYLNNLLLAGYVIERIKKDQRENNTFLLAETANTLVRALNQHDAQFILMKAGIRYHHIMLDEFQDTSTLQWDNFKRLIQEILASNGTALIVGDTKQSIYRWRNGDYEIMNGLNTDADLSHNYNPQNLIRNFRSRREIVQFNLETFQRLSQDEAVTNPAVGTMYDELYQSDQDHDINAYYRAGKKEGGYVCLRQFASAENKHDSNEAAKDELLNFMFTQMEDLLAHGYRNKDMLILCRSASEAKRVIKAFHTIKADHTRFPYLHQAGKIVSNDSFLLESSIAVNTIISALKVLIRYDAVAQQYIQFNHPATDMKALKNLSVTLPLTDLIEQIIRLTLCHNGEYQGQDIAHLNCLRDKIRGYISKYGTNIEDFLKYWDDKMHSDAIPATDSDDIHIMTIHSSKGLQAKNIFLPFCSWKQEEDGKKKETLWCKTPMTQATEMYIPVSYGKNMTQLPELSAIHETERKKQRVDALNLLYVACTRAEDNLFILEYKSTNTGNTAGQWLTNIHGTSRDWGTINYPSPQEKTDGIPEPFSFEHATAIQASYHSANADIHFRQSQIASQVMRALAQHENIDNIEFGNLCHAVLEQIQTTDDLDAVLQDFYMRGSIPNHQSMNNIRNLILRLLNHPQACNWFNGSYQLMREDSVLACPVHQDNATIQEFRMDRVMIRDREAVVLDYKFGNEKSEHISQVQNYMHILQSMGYIHVRGFLWYAFHNNLREVTL